MPAPPRDIRKLAFQVLFQLDARGERDAPAIRESALAEDNSSLSGKDRERAFDLAAAAFAARADADRAMLELAPTWPTHRQAAVDRAILRLAHFEMVSGRTPPKIAVNEAVELAKEFSTDKSPAFVNGLLDKVLKRVLALQSASAGTPIADQPLAELPVAEPPSSEQPSADLPTAEPPEPASH